ncbi:MAG TPA: DNA-formamidopyrimidine glycosylase family protein [Actinomycetota bacterium]|nr:DNA-formamidopyrimidine glycosylase family protein [Actinomycetota bacterium]
MPELPQMQALAERLWDVFADAVVKRVDLLQFSALKTFDPPPTELHGSRLRSTDRRGKFLILNFDELRVLIHLSQSGRVEIENPPKTSKAKGAVARVHFAARPAMFVKEYGTDRKAGLWILRSEDPGPLATLGPEPSSLQFANLILEGSDRRQLHTMLRDQHTVAGIGRGFTDDALHRAQLSPFNSLSGLNDEERRRLLEAIGTVLEEGLAKERTRSGGLPPKLGDHFTIHGRFGKPCPRCGAPLQRVSYESHEIVYCPPCQTGGKVLADRRLSKLIK